MIIHHKTRREAKQTTFHLRHAGLEASEATRGPARGNQKFWWLVETPFPEDELVGRLAEIGEHFQHYVTVYRDKLTRLRAQNERLEVERDNAVAELKSFQEAING